MNRVTDVAVERFASNPLVVAGATNASGGTSTTHRSSGLPTGSTTRWGDTTATSAITRGRTSDSRTPSPQRPWTVYESSVLPIKRTRFTDHIASPDAHIDHDERRVRLYFHGCTDGEQETDVAVSSDGLDFAPLNKNLGGDRLRVFLIRRFDRPERIMFATVDLSGSDHGWRAVPYPPETVLWPDRTYESGGLPLETSSYSAAHEPMRALRDPTVFHDDGRTYLYYAVAGEQGIAGAEIRDDG